MHSNSQYHSTTISFNIWATQNGSLYHNTHLCTANDNFIVISQQLTIHGLNT